MLAFCRKMAVDRHCSCVWGVRLLLVAETVLQMDEAAAACIVHAAGMNSSGSPFFEWIILTDLDVAADSTHCTLKHDVIPRSVMFHNANKEVQFTLRLLLVASLFVSGAAPEAVRSEWRAYSGTHQFSCWVSSTSTCVTSPQKFKLMEEIQKLRVIKR